jgi:hypothetical protein
MHVFGTHFVAMPENYLFCVMFLPCFSQPCRISGERPHPPAPPTQTLPRGLQYGVLTGISFAEIVHLFLVVGMMEVKAV